MYEYLNGADKFSIANQFAVCVPMVLFIFFSVFFALCRAPKLVSLHKHKQLVAQKDKISEVRDEFLRT